MNILVYMHIVLHVCILKLFLYEPETNDNLNVEPLKDSASKNVKFEGKKCLLTCVRRKEAAGGADALTQAVHFWLGRWVQRHRQEVVEVDGMSLTLDQAGQAASRWLQALLLQDLADAGVHACVPEGPGNIHLKCKKVHVSAQYKSLK